MNIFMFSVEEMNLMCIFNINDKNALLTELRDSLRGVYEPDMREVYKSTIEKLAKMSDADFAEIGLYIADEYIDGEEYDIAE